MGEKLLELLSHISKETPALLVVGLVVVAIVYLFLREPGGKVR